MDSYKNLHVYSKSINFVLNIYTITKDFPSEEKFGLVSQLRRASVSIPSNIAEGAQRQSKNEYAKFLFMSFGSCAEVETQLLISLRLQFISLKDHSKLIEELTIISKMLRKLILSLKNEVRLKNLKVTTKLETNN